MAEGAAWGSAGVGDDMVGHGGLETLMKQRQIMIGKEENDRDMLRNEETWKERHTVPLRGRIADRWSCVDF